MYFRIACLSLCVSFFFVVLTSCGGKQDDAPKESTPLEVAIGLVEASFTDDVDTVIKALHISDEWLQSDDAEIILLHHLKPIIENRPSQIREEFGVHPGVPKKMNDRELLYASYRMNLLSHFDRMNTDLGAAKKNERRAIRIKELKQSKVTYENGLARISTRLGGFTLIEVNGVWKLADPYALTSLYCFVLIINRLANAENNWGRDME